MEVVKDNNNDSQNVDSSANTTKLLTTSNSQPSHSQSPQYTHNWQAVAGRLQYLCNKYGDFKVAKSWKTSDGEIYWSKHRSVMECWETEKMIYWLGQVSHRQILPCEIVIDLDDKPTIQKLNWICEHLEAMNVSYIAYFTGSKGYHIHIKDRLMFDMTKSQKEYMRLKLLEAFGADLHKKDEVMIALEDVPHWKTGKIKTEIRRSSNWQGF